MSVFLDAALAYAARGWAVFPLRVRDKRPMIEQTRPGANDGGFHLATTDEAQIRAWWARWPKANIGLATGGASGVFVLDLDGSDAEAGLCQLQAESGFADLPLTLQQFTGKGRHLLFKHVAGVRNRGGGYLIDGKRIACPGFDVRGDGGYIVLPPSIHPSGRTYAWADVNAAIADAPEWLLRAIVPPPPKPAAPLADYKGQGQATAYGEKALESACRRVACAMPGTRHNTLAGEAAAIGELVAGGEIQRGYAERALVAAATAMMGGAVTPRELSKIAWGFEAGRSNPRKVTRARPAREHLRAEVGYAPPPAQATREDVWLRGRVLIHPPEATATLIVAGEDLAERAALAWEDSHGGAYGLFAVKAPTTLREGYCALAGGLAVNAGGYPDWRTPAPNLHRPAATTRWRGRVLIVRPEELESFTLSAGTKWEKFISATRHAQVLSLLATHWWKHAGASDVAFATLPAEEVEGSEHVAV